MTNQQRALLCARVAVAATALLAAAALQAEPTSTMMLTQPCGACHGTQGISAGPTLPNLAGIPKQVLVDAMQEFKSGDRAASLMGRIAKAYSDPDFEAMAAYFSALPRPVVVQELDAQQVARGAQLYLANCGECHIASGRADADAPPVLAGQWLGYLRMQMQTFLDGGHKMPIKMKARVKGLSAQDLDAVLQFYASSK